MGTQIIQVTTDYTIVKGSTEEVIGIVSEMIKEQWQPLGAAFSTGYELDNQDVCQTMVKHGFATVQQGGGGRIAVPTRAPTKVKLGAGG